MLYNASEFSSSLPAGFDGQFEWDFLAPAFERGIMPMDLDAVVETHGKFLVFETKRPGAEIPKGQKLTLWSLLNIPTFTVVFLNGKCPDEFRSILVGNGKYRYEFKDDSPSIVTDKIVEFSSAWFTVCDRTERRCLSAVDMDSLGFTVP